MKWRAGAMAAILGTALTLAACSSSSDTEAPPSEINSGSTFDLAQLSKLKDHLEPGMTLTMDSEQKSITAQDVEQQRQVREQYASATVQPEECRDYVISGETLAVGSRFASEAVQYGNTLALLVVTEMPENAKVDIDHAMRCSLASFSAQDVTVTNAENTNPDQQVAVDGLKQIATVSTATVGGPDAPLGKPSYEYRGWWDDRHYIKMTVTQVDPAGNGIDITPALGLFSTAVDLVSH